MSDACCKVKTQPRSALPAWSPLSLQALPARTNFLIPEVENSTWNVKEVTLTQCVDFAKFGWATATQLIFLMFVFVVLHHFDWYEHVWTIPATIYLTSSNIRTKRNANFCRVIVLKLFFSHLMEIRGYETSRNHMNHWPYCPRGNEGTWGKKWQPLVWPYDIQVLACWQVYLHTTSNAESEPPVWTGSRWFKSNFWKKTTTRKIIPPSITLGRGQGWIPEYWQHPPLHIIKTTESWMIISQWKSVIRLAGKSVDPGNCDTVTQVKLFSVLLASQCTSYTIANCSKMVWRRPQSRHSWTLRLGPGHRCITLGQSGLVDEKLLQHVVVCKGARKHLQNPNGFGEHLPPASKLKQTIPGWYHQPITQLLDGGKKNIPNGNRNLESTSVKNIQRINLTSFSEM